MDIASLLRRYYERWSDQDSDGVRQFFTDTSVFEDLAFEARFEGRKQIRSFVDLTFSGVPDFRVTPKTIIVDGNKVAATWVMSGTHSGDMPGLPATGKPFLARATSIVVFEGQQIKTIVDYWNPDSFKRSVGLI